MKLENWTGLALLGGLAYIGYRAGLFDSQKSPITLATESRPTIKEWVLALPFETRQEIIEQTPTTATYAPLPTLINPEPTQVIVTGQGATAETIVQAINNAADWAIQNKYNIMPTAQAEAILFETQKAFKIPWYSGLFWWM